ncbi:MAG: hypothetical protein WA705_10330 [Candidatus Ozemobacteraceae bacterium]
MLLEVDENASPILKLALLISSEVIRKDASEAVIEASAGKMSIKLMVGETLEMFFEPPFGAYESLLNCFANMANWPPNKPLQGNSEPFCLSSEERDFFFYLSIISTGQDGPGNRNASFDEDFLETLGEELGENDGPIPRLSRVILREMVTKKTSEAVIDGTTEMTSFKIQVGETLETIKEFPIRAFDLLLRRFKILANWLPTQPLGGKSQPFRFRHDEQEFFFTISIPPVQGEKVFRINPAPVPRKEFRLIRKPEP